MARSVASAFVLAAASAAFAPSAGAVPIPPPVEAMLDASASDLAKLEVVADIARKTNPDSLVEIDSRVAFLRDDAEKRRIARLSSLNFREGWTGQGEAGGSISTGNTDESGAALSLNLAKETVLRRDRVNALVDRKTSAGIETAERYFAGYQSDYKFGERLYANLLASAEKDPFAGLHSRFSESVGVGYRVLTGGSRAANMTLDLELGLAARQTRYLDNGSEATVGVRGGARYEWKLRPDTVLTEIASAYVDEQSNTVESSTAVTTRLIGALSWRGSFNVRYESNPPPPRETTDTTTRFSLVYAF